MALPSGLATTTIPASDANRTSADMQQQDLPTQTSDQNGHSSAVTPEKESSAAQALASLVSDLQDGERCDRTLKALVKRREKLSNLAPMLWNTGGTVHTLTKIVEDAYPYLHDPSSFSIKLANRACAALALFQVLGAHSETRDKLLESNIVQLLRPFLVAQSRDERVACLRTTALGVVASLLKSVGVDHIAVDVRNDLQVLCRGTPVISCDHAKRVATYVSRKLQGKRSRGERVQSGTKRVSPFGVIGQRQENATGVTAALFEGQHMIWGDIDRFTDSQISSAGDRSADSHEERVAPFWESRKSRNKIPEGAGMVGFGQARRFADGTDRSGDNHTIWSSVSSSSGEVSPPTRRCVHQQEEQLAHTGMFLRSAQPSATATNAGPTSL